MKTAFVVRTGGIGDMFEAASVCAGLRKQGHRVIFGGFPDAMDVLKLDPHIEQFIDLSNKRDDVVAWSKMLYEISKGYDRYIPLLDIVDHTLLTNRESMHYHVSPAARHLLCDQNYLEVLHAAAKVPHEPHVRFYPTEDELKWALDAQMKWFTAGATKIVLIVTHGSAVNKIWPHNEKLIEAILRDFDDAHVVLTGGESARKIEEPWFGHPRVHSLCRQITTRQFLTLPAVVDVLIGPETGIFYAASQMAVPKIIFLSHATVRNLTRDWINTHSLQAPSVTCTGRGKNEAPACHMVHNDWTTCTRALDPACPDCKIGGRCAKHLAACQQAIPPGRVMDVLRSIFAQEKLCLD